MITLLLLGQVLLGQVSLIFATQTALVDLNEKKLYINPATNATAVADANAIELQRLDTNETLLTLQQVNFNISEQGSIAANIRSEQEKLIYETRQQAELGIVMRGGALRFADNSTNLNEYFIRVNVSLDNTQPRLVHGLI